MRDFGDAETAFRSEEGSFRSRTGISAREAEALELRDLSETDRVLALAFVLLTLILNLVG